MRRQRGIATALLISVLVACGVLFAFTSYKFSAVSVERQRSTDDALAMAKEALIAYAVADDNRPGELPCPDVDDDGQVTLAAEYAGSNCVSLIGRLPYRTLGLPDLRDDSGERLWYTLSNDFHANGTVALNSDTAFRAGNTSLAITGVQAASNLVAIVFAPGPVLRRQGATALQDRTPGPAALNAVNYLDLAAGQDNADLDRNYVAAPKSETFNDRLLPVFSDDIMQLVERRAARELAQNLRNHYDAWASAPSISAASRKGFYPWAAPLNDPTVPAPGVNNTSDGQLPLAASSVVWDSASAPLGSCGGVNTNQITCSGVLIGLVLTINGRVRNVGTAFVDPPSAGLPDVSVSGVALAPTVTWTLNPAAQTLDFTWSAILGTVVTVTVRAPRTSAWTTGSWLATNNWHQNALYAVSPGYAISGNGACGGAGPSCITVSNTVGTTNNKHAVVLMTGRALSLASPAQNPRPVIAPAAATQFLEAGNATLADLVFEQNARTASFNDYAVAVRP